MTVCSWQCPPFLSAVTATGHIPLSYQLKSWEWTQLTCYFLLLHNTNFRNIFIWNVWKSVSIQAKKGALIIPVFKKPVQSDSFWEEELSFRKVCLLFSLSSSQIAFSIVIEFHSHVLFSAISAPSFTNSLHTWSNVLPAPSMSFRTVATENVCY